MQDDYHYWHVNQTSDNETWHLQSNMLDNPVVRGLALLGYSLVFVLGISGNLGIIFTVYRRRETRNTVNLLVANLAWSDICTCMIPNVFTPLNVFHSWPLGECMCRFLPMISSSSIFVSSLTSTVIALDRYMLVHLPNRRFLTRGRLLVTVALIWAVALLFSLPISFFSEIELDQCIEYWPEHLHNIRKYYTWTCFSIQFVAPSIIVLYSYLRIIRTLNSRLRRNFKKGWNVLAKRRIRKIQATWRINKMLMLMVASFMICYLPMNVFNIVVELAEPHLVHLGSYILVPYLLVHWIAMSSTIYNPLLCITLNSDFRPRCLRQRSSPANSMEFTGHQKSTLL